MNRIGYLLAGTLFVMTGCLGKDQTTRSQIDDDAEKASVRTIGEVAEFQTSGSIPISGVGLIVGLEGTGGGTPPGTYRQMMEDYLKKCKIEDPKGWLDSPNNALVLVNAEIPVGTRRNDLINVEITLPPGSKARSLRGGYLLETPMMSYASQSQVRTYLEQNTNVQPQSIGDGLLKGHILAIAEGPIQVVLKDKEAAKERDANDMPEGGVKRGFVWKGARMKAPQPYFIVMNPDQQRYRKAMIVADRINETFHGPGAGDKIAISRNADTIMLYIPPQYRGNIPHFLRIIRMIPEDRMEENSSYRQKLEEQLKQPETTISAALRLEALGRNSIPALRSTMQASPYPLVRFASAEALAYLGEPICANELARLTENHPSLQAYCLTALSSLDEAASSFALQGLLGSEIPEVRYGAFRALREVDPTAEASRGKKLNKCFWLHKVAPQSKPLVHLLGSMRAEVVLFGKQPQLTAPFSFQAGPDLVVTAKRGDAGVTISRFSTHKAQRQEQCSFAVEDIIKTMADMGAQYADVADMLMQARDTKSLDCELAMDALPKAVPMQTLAQNAIADPNMEKEMDLLKSVDQATAVNVFDRSSRR